MAKLAPAQMRNLGIVLILFSIILRWASDFIERVIGLEGTKWVIYGLAVFCLLFGGYLIIKWR